MIVLFGGVEVLYAGLSIDYGTAMASAAPAGGPAGGTSSGRPGAAAIGGNNMTSGSMPRERGGPDGLGPAKG